MSTMKIAGDSSTPSAAVALGMRDGDKGTHTSRTIMLDELQVLLAATDAAASRDDYVRAVTRDNILAKRTASTRRLTGQRLSELYALSPEVSLFRVLRQFWDLAGTSRPLLAMLLALGRDPLLRATAEPVLSLAPGDEVGRQAVTDALRAAVGERLNDATLDKVVRNSLSSWTQSGHLTGRVRKYRQVVEPTPLVVVYALLLAYISGQRGARLFDSFWCRVLDRPMDELIFLTMDAKRLGVIDFKQAGNVIEVNFRDLLTPDERKLIDEQG